MAKLTRADLFSQDSTDSGPTTVEALAPLATGVNKDGTNFSVEPPDTVVTANLAAVNAAATLAVPLGQTTVTFAPLGTWAGTATFEFSPDGGTTWPALGAARADSAAGSVATSTTTANSFWEAAIPAGTTHVRLRCSAYTSGTINARVSTSYSQYEPAISVAGINSSNTTIGGLTKTTLVNDEVAATPGLATLAAAATGFGAVRDLTGASLGASAAGVGKFPDRLRAHVSADQPFTLGVEFDSAVGFTTQSEAGNVVAVAGRGGRYFASLDVAVLNRFARVYVTNTGAAAMTTGRVFTVQVG